LQHLFEVLQSTVTASGSVDDFGFDPEFTETILLPIIRPIYHAWFRVQIMGVENISVDEPFSATNKYFRIKN